MFVTGRTAGQRVDARTTRRHRTRARNRLDVETPADVSGAARSSSVVLKR